MSTGNTANPFQALDKSRFKKARAEAPGVSPAAPAAGKKKTAPSRAPSLTDESALFLRAMGQNEPVRRGGGTNEDDFAAMLAAQEGRRDAAEKFPERTERGRAEPPGAGETPAPPNPANPQEEALFVQAVDGVAPLRARGRALPPPPRPAGMPAPAAVVGMDDLLAGGLEFALEYTDEFIQGHVLGLDPAVMGKMRAGSYSPEGHIDLHGQNMEQAYVSLANFIRFAYQDGKRHLLLITGRGRNSPGGTPVLRERVQAWLTRDPFKRVILAFCTAKPGDGGAGALYLLLRKRKKNQGKIVWDRTPSEEELLL